MANPQEKARAEASTVSSCAATDCRHNENKECHAGEIRVEVGAGGAVCGTYEPESSKPRP
jgi:hypothetical protein